MAGPEAVGMLLNLYPVVLDIYRTFRGLRSGQDRDSLAKDLGNEEVIFIDSVRVLYPHMASTEFVENMEPSWEDSDAQSELENFFTPYKAMRISSTVEDLRVELKKLRRDIAGSDTSSVSNTARR